MTSTANEDAEDLRTGTNNLDWGEVSRLKMTATRERPGHRPLEEIQPFAGDGRLEGGKPGDVAARMRQVRNETLSDWIGHLHEDDRYGYGADRPPVCMTNDIFTLVVDHVGKDKKRGIMGSIAKVANADVVLLLDVNKKNGTVTSSKMILHMMRGGAAGTVNRFSLKQTPENEHGDSFVTVDWHGIEQISLSSVCNQLLRCITECEDPGDLLSPKKDLRVKEEDVRKRFYHAYKGDGENVNRNAFNLAKAQVIKNDLIKVERNLMWLV